VAEVLGRQRCDDDESGQAKEYEECVFQRYRISDTSELSIDRGK
jgi:hypothetical protein